MATGFTHDIESGKITTLPEFALRCARAFGALITMRDDCMSAAIPDVIEPDTSYYDQRIRESQERLGALRIMSVDEAVAAADAEWQSAMQGWQERQTQRSAKRTRYEAMLEKVRAWNPPTPEHIGLKEFMVEQLESSMKIADYEDEAPQSQHWKAWHEEQVEREQRSLLRSTEERTKEIDRAASRTAWIQALKASLKDA